MRPRVPLFVLALLIGASTWTMHRSSGADAESRRGLNEGGASSGVDAELKGGGRPTPAAIGVSRSVEDGTAGNVSSEDFSDSRDAQPIDAKVTAAAVERADAAAALLVAHLVTP